jgi:hypothetical protein
MQLQEAEVLLADFRTNLRSDLRLHVARAELSAATVEQLRVGLEEVRKAVLASL